MKKFELQPTLENEFIKIQPLKQEDFEAVYLVASNPLIWEQHPNPDRYKKEVFETFFKDAMESGGAFLVFDKQSNMVIGSSRYYELDTDKSSIAIGYTFLAKDHWGSVYNPALKKLMIDHAFQFFNSVVFHIGAFNIRSQKAVERLGARKMSEKEVECYGEASKLKVLYEIKKYNWNLE
ncbi:MAG: GNAT family N-acetyltransferase [Burkholderiales bacterium]|nr:GNAT family N-acetyltransferase [Bacteroidia bacterium]